MSLQINLHMSRWRLTMTQILAWAHSQCTLIAKVNGSTLHAAETTAHQAGEMQSHTEQWTFIYSSCCHFLKLHVAGNVRQNYRIVHPQNRWSGVM